MGEQNPLLKIDKERFMEGGDSFSRSSRGGGDFFIILISCQQKLGINLKYSKQYVPGWYRAFTEK
jgi:hypothetical protein